MKLLLWLHWNHVFLCRNKSSFLYYYIISCKSTDYLSIYLDRWQFCSPGKCRWGPLNSSSSYMSNTCKLEHLGVLGTLFIPPNPQQTRLFFQWMAMLRDDNWALTAWVPDLLTCTSPQPILDGRFAWPRDNCYYFYYCCLILLRL